MNKRRTSQRHQVSIMAKLTLNGETGDVPIENLSLGGAFVVLNRRFVMGQRMHLTFSVPTLREAVSIDVTVRWSDQRGVGLQFDGLRAREVWALNEFFKQLSSSP